MYHEADEMTKMLVEEIGWSVDDSVGTALRDWLEARINGYRESQRADMDDEEDSWGELNDEAVWNEVMEDLRGKYSPWSLMVAEELDDAYTRLFERSERRP